MSNSAVDYYEVLQISTKAEPETIHRVYRMLAQRFHPDNQDTGDAEQFRLLAEAYHTVADPEQRARYDVAYHQQRQERWRIVPEDGAFDTDLNRERTIRTTVLEVLYVQRRLEPHAPGVFAIDLEQMTGTPREHLEFTVWFLIQKRLVQRTDNSMLAITADGVEYLERHMQGLQKRLVARSH